MGLGFRVCGGVGGGGWVYDLGLSIGECIAQYLSVSSGVLLLTLKKPSKTQGRFIGLPLACLSVYIAPEAF